MFKRPLPLVLILLGALALPTIALGSTRAGSGTDPAGDAEAHHDIGRVSVTYKSGGTISASVALGSPPQSGSLIAVMLSKSKGGKCFSNTAVGGVGYLPATGEAFAFAGNKRIKAKAKVRGNKVTLKARNRKLAKQPFNCADFAAGPADATIASDLLDRPIKLKRRR
jgi:hypothetical protein